MTDNQNNQTSTNQPQNAPGAIAGMVCGIVGLVLNCIPVAGIALGIVGIVLFVKVNKLTTADPQLQGKGMATAGMICGIIAIIANFFWTMYYILWGAIFSCISTPMMSEMLKK